MTVKDVLNKIRKETPYTVNSYDTISELVDLLKEDNAAGGGKRTINNINADTLNTLLSATQNRRNSSYYYTIVSNKLGELFPSKKEKITVLYTQSMHTNYMKAVLADSLEADSTYNGKTFDDIIKTIDDKTDATGFSKLVIDPSKFLDGDLNKEPTDYQFSWDLLLDLLAGKDVKVGLAEESIKERLDNSRILAAGDSVKSITDFLSTASEDQKKIFQKNIEQSLLMATFPYCANFRENVRFFELFNMDSGGGTSTRDAYKGYFNKGTNQKVSHKFAASATSGRAKPYGGRICPITFGGNSMAVNNFKSHPFSWMFFRDITDESEVVPKLGFFKMIYRDGKQYEAPLPVHLPKQLFDTSTDGYSDIGKLNRCDDGAPFGDEKNIRLENISISFKGTTPTTAQNDVDVTVTFHIPRISSLNKKFNYVTYDENGSALPYDWKILDFITYYGNSDLRSEVDLGYVQNTKYSAVNSRLLLKVGYNESRVNNLILKDVLLNSPMILDLSVIDHTIAKDPVKPEAKLTVKYAGFIMKLFNSPMTDVMAGDDLKTRLERQKIINFAQEQNCNPKILDELYQNNKALNKSENSDLHSKIISKLYERARIFKTPYQPSNIRQNSRVIGESVYFTSKFYNDFLDDIDVYDQWNNIMGSAPVSEESTIVSALSDTGITGFVGQDIYWTTIGDIIDVAMDTIYEEPKFKLDETVKKVREISGGSVEKHKEFFNYNPLKVITTELYGNNIADYPVAISFLREWITEEIAEQDFDFYPLMGFIKQIIQACVTNFINRGKSNAERPTIVAVDSDLALPINPSILAGSKLSLKQLKDLNLTYWDMNYLEKFKSGIKYSKSQNHYDSANLLIRNEIKDKEDPYKAACYRDGGRDMHAFQKFRAKEAKYGAPLLTKRFSASRQDYFNVIYCYTYPSTTADYLPYLTSESDCIAYGIPVIRLPDFKYNYESTTIGAELKNPTTLDESADFDLMDGLDEAVEDNIVVAGDDIPFNSSQVVKSIKFTKKDDDYLREARYSSQHYGLFAQLTSVYSATVELQVLCTFLSPGMLVYIDGDTGDTIFEEGSLASSLGLGGVHIITSVQHKATFEENTLKGFTTTFDALYVYNGSQIKRSTPKKAKEIEEDNKRKEELCNDLFESLIKAGEPSSIAKDDTTRFDAILYSNIGTTKLNAVEEDDKSKKKQYYEDPKIKKVYQQQAVLKNTSLIQIDTIEFEEEWDETKPDLTKQKMYKITVSKKLKDGKEEQLAEPEVSYINYLGDIIETETKKEEKTDGK